MKKIILEKPNFKMVATLKKQVRKKIKTIHQLIQVKKNRKNL